MSDEMYERVFEQAVSLWVRPEIDRRNSEGSLPADFALVAAQVIMNPGEPVEVRLNSEVVIVARAKVRRAVERGEWLTGEDIEGLQSLELTDRDPNAGHLTMVLTKDGWVLAFDFRHNATRIDKVLALAEEFLRAAYLATKDGLTRPAVDMLFSSAELVATAQLLEVPVVGTRTTKSHATRQSDFNRYARANAAREFVELFNRLGRVRNAARYSEPGGCLTHGEATEAPEIVRHMAAIVRTRAPKRQSVPPDLAPGLSLGNTSGAG